MTDILSDLQKLIRCGGYSYSSYEVMDLVRGAAAEIERQRGVMAEINKIAHTPTPQGMRAYTHFQRDFDRIRTLTAV